MEKAHSQGKSISVLCLEDMKADADLIRERLTEEGYALQFETVSTEKTFLNKIRKNNYDVILSDFNIPGYNGLSAMNHAKQICPEVPFIFISGAIGEDTAVELIKNGAVDYVSKDRLQRLPIVVERALLDVERNNARRNAEESLRKSEYEFRQLAEAMPQIVWITRPDGWNIYFNQQWVDYTGLTLEESYGHGWIIPFHPDDNSRAWDAWQNATNHGAIYSIECRLRRNDGVYKWWLIRGVPLLDADGTILKWFGTCTDIAELKQTVEELRDLNLTLEQRVAERTKEFETANKDLKMHIQEIEQYTHLASHDLQEPLRTISSFAQLLREDYAEVLDAEGKKFIETIYHSSTRMRELVQGLLEYSLLGKNRVMTTIDCQKTCIEVIADINDTIQRNQAAVTLGKLPVIQGYAVEIRLLFQNLLNNAIKFKKSNVLPQVTISAEAQQDEWIFSVSDNGIGIDDKHKEKIFDMFHRIHSKTEYEGTGIGLAHCKKITELHGGRIWVESEPGKGSTFIFTIPK